MANTTTKSQDLLKSGAQEMTQADVEVSKVGITVLGFMAAAIGIWGIACFVGGLISAGGPISFVKGWFGAVFGM